MANASIRSLSAVELEDLDQRYVIALTPNGTVARGRAFLDPESMEVTVTWLNSIILTPDDYVGIAYRQGINTEEFAAVSKTRIAITTEGGTTYTELPAEAIDNGITGVVWLEGNIVVADSFGTVYGLDNASGALLYRTVIGLGNIAAIGNNQTTLFVVDDSGNVRISINNGVTWTIVNNCGLNHPVTITATNTGPTIFVVDSEGNGRLSMDNGITWSPFIRRPDITEIVSMFNTFIIAFDGGFQITLDGTASWMTLSNPVTELGIAFSCRLFVKAAGERNSGQTWDTATTLADALERATNGCEIWVQEGTYRGDHSIRSGVQLYGGFKGDETAVSNRDVNAGLAKTIVIGETSTFTIRNGTAETVLDGFTIKGGSGKEVGGTSGFGGGLFIHQGKPTIRNCWFDGNDLAIIRGGAVMNLRGDPVFLNCAFQGCTAQNNGGAVCNYGIGPSGAHRCSPTFTNCVFFNNTAEEDCGGAIYIDNNAKAPVLPTNPFGTATFTNCTFWGNTAQVRDELSGLDGAGNDIFALWNTKLIIRNCILWSEGAGFNLVNSHSGELTNEISFSDIREYNIDPLSIQGVNNLVADPLFTNVKNIDSVSPFASDFGLRLDQNSPCLDKGSTQFGIDTEITGLEWGEKKSMGAYESANSIQVQGEGIVTIPIKIPPRRRLTGVTLTVRGAFGGDSYTGTTLVGKAVPPELLNVDIDTPELLELIVRFGFLILTGLSLQALNSTTMCMSAVFNGAGGGATVLAIPTVELLERQAKAEESGEFANYWRYLSEIFLADINNILVIAPGGGGARRVDDGAALQPQRAAAAGSGGEMRRGPIAPGVQPLVAREDAQDEWDAESLPGDASAGHGFIELQSNADGTCEVQPDGRTTANDFSEDSFRIFGVLLGGLAGLIAYAIDNGNLSEIFTVEANGGGGGCGYTGGDGGARGRAGQPGTDYVSPKIKRDPAVNSLSTPSNEGMYDNEIQGDVKIKAAQSDWFQQVLNNSATWQKFLEGNVDALLDNLYSADVAGITNERSKQGLVKISYTTEQLVGPIPPTPTSSLPQDKEIISTTMIYDWQINNSQHNIQVNLSDS